MYDLLSARYCLNCYRKPCGNSRRKAWKAFLSICRGIHRGKGYHVQTW